MEIGKILSNSVRIRVLQYLQSCGQATTKQIAAKLSDVPLPTLYRHIDFLLKEEALLVKSEHKVRGSTERTLCINAEKLAQSANPDILHTAYQFLMGIYAKFDRYSRQAQVDPVKDRLCLSTSELCMSDREFDAFWGEIAEIMKRYSKNDLAAGRRMRNISLISAPEPERSSQRGTEKKGEKANGL